MNKRGQSLALIIATALCLVACLCATILRPANRLEHASTQPINYRIDPNQADAATLCLLPGIAQGKARLIIEDRNNNGTFHHLHDLTRVPQIGDKTIVALQPHLHFSE